MNRRPLSPDQRANQAAPRAARTVAHTTVRPPGLAYTRYAQDPGSRGRSRCAPPSLLRRRDGRRAAGRACRRRSLERGLRRLARAAWRPCARACSPRRPADGGCAAARAGGRGQPARQRDAARLAQSSPAQGAPRLHSARGRRDRSRWPVRYVSDAAAATWSIDLQRRSIVRRLFVGSLAHHLDFSPNGRRLWVALGERRHIVRLDLRTSRPRVVGHPSACDRAWHRVLAERENRVGQLFRGAVRNGVRSGVGQGAAEDRRRKGPQEIAFSGKRALVTSGYGSSLEAVSWRTYGRHGSVSMPYGSFNLATFGGRGRCELGPDRLRHGARSRDAEAHVDDEDRAGDALRRNLGVARRSRACGPTSRA